MTGSEMVETGDGRAIRGLRVEDVHMIARRRKKISHTVKELLE